MTDQRKSLGRRGEEAALTYLKKNRYKILTRNYQTRLSEIDIIALKKKVIHIIEVKTRMTLSKGYPREAVTRNKQRRIIQGAQLYLQQNQLHDTLVQFDVIEVFLETGAPQINMISNAFEADII